MASEVVTTDYERMLIDAFNKYGDSTPIVEHIICFKCYQYFHWAKAELPKQCMKCNESVEYGTVARPDLIILYNNDIAVIRVQGGIHYKNRRNKKYDHFQMLKFLQHGIPVFDVTNEEAEFLHDHSWPLISFVIMVEYMIEEGFETYDLYMKNPEIKARWNVT